MEHTMSKFRIRFFFPGWFKSMKSFLLARIKLCHCEAWVLYSALVLEGLNKSGNFLSVQMMSKWWLFHRTCFYEVLLVFFEKHMSLSKLVFRCTRVGGVGMGCCMNYRPDNVAACWTTTSSLVEGVESQWLGIKSGISSWSKTFTKRTQEGPD